MGRMAKLKCEACKKKCKKQAVKAHDKHYHPECFICSSCHRPLPLDRFYRNENQNFCESDYYKLFGKWCCVCSKVILNDVIVAKGRNYHAGCLKCSACNKQFKSGETATFKGERIFCGECFGRDTEESAVSKAAGDAKEANNYPVDSANAVSKENNGMNNEKILKKDAESKVSPVNVVDSATNQSLMSSMISPKLEEEYQTADHKYPISPSPNLSVDQSSISAMHYNTSDGYPYEQNTLRSGHSQYDSSINKSVHSSSFGIPNNQFYNMSYLERVGTNTTLRRESQLVGPSSARSKSNTHFHRPNSEFTFKSPREDLKLTLKRGNQMNQGLDVLVRNLNAAPSHTLNRRSPSTLPTFVATYFDDGVKSTHSKSDALRPIERLDWPSPPFTAAAYPELLRNKSERDLLATSSQEASSEVNDSSKSQAFAKLERKICELEKIASMESGTAAVILKELKKQRSVEVEVDPRDTSRDPSAEKSLSIVFKCQRPRLASPTGTLPRFATMSDGRRCVSSMMNHHNFALPRCHSLKYKSYLSSAADNNFKMNEDRLPMHSTPVDVVRKLHLASSEDGTVDCVVVRDPITGLKKQSSIKMRSLTLPLPPSNSPMHISSYMHHDEQRHPPHKTHQEHEYTLSELQDALNCNNQLQLNRSCLEEYLTDMEFESLFNMSKQEFKALRTDQQLLLKQKYSLA